MDRAPDPRPGSRRELTGTLELRRATLADVDVLAALNEQLIIDQRHENPMRGAALAARMRGWLDEGGYHSALGYVDGQPVLYALWRNEPEGVHLRQFFVAAANRRLGLGRQALDILRREHWPTGARVSIDVLSDNQRGIDFWHALGFHDYSTRMRLSTTPAKTRQTRTTSPTAPYRRSQR